MAFISDKKRESLIKKINKSYGFRKVLICLEMALLVGFIATMFASMYNDIAWFTKTAEGGFEKLTTLGWGMFAWAIIMVVLGIITLVLILTLKSPKDVTAEVSTLGSSAISGKRVKRTDKALKVIKERTTAKKPKAE